MEVLYCWNIFIRKANFCSHTNVCFFKPWIGRCGNGVTELGVRIKSSLHFHLHLDFIVCTAVSMSSLEKNERRNSETGIIQEKVAPWGSWVVAQSVKCPTLDFSSGHDQGNGIEPCVGFYAEVEPAYDSLSPSASPCLPHERSCACFLSLLKKKEKAVLSRSFILVTSPVTKYYLLCIADN